MSSIGGCGLCMLDAPVVVVVARCWCSAIALFVTQKSPPRPCVSLADLLSGWLSVVGASTRSCQPVSRQLEANRSNAQFTHRLSTFVPFLHHPFARSTSTMASPKDLIETLVASNPVVVYAKSYCPHCAKTKALLSELGVHFVLVQLDEIPDGEALQNALADLTGASDGCRSLRVAVVVVVDCCVHRLRVLLPTSAVDPDVGSVYACMCVRVLQVSAQCRTSSSAASPAVATRTSKRCTRAISLYRCSRSTVHLRDCARHKKARLRAAESSENRQRVATLHCIPPHTNYIPMHQ